MNVDPSIFRAYDIRGKVGPSLTAGVVEALGRAFGTRIAGEGGRRIAVGRDNRLSSDELHDALVRGLLASGCDVLDLGLSTSPYLYFATASQKLDGGVNVSGSHNPKDENGLKFVGPDAKPVAGDELLDLKKRVEGEAFRSGSGRSESLDLRREYFAHLKAAAGDIKRFTVVVDTGNGVAGAFAPDALREIGCDVVELYTELDGNFPNHLPDPQMPENVADLQARVRETGADAGLAFDGDGDRLGVIDEKGERHEADHMLALLARDVVAQAPGGTVILDVKTSQATVEDIEAHGGAPMFWKTGHSLIKLKMRELDAPLAGENSGHVFYRENFFMDDGLFAACKLLRYISHEGAALSALFASLPAWLSTPEQRVPCADGDKATVVEAVAAALRDRYPCIELDGVRAAYPDGWALVRASNTGPNLTLRFEARTPERLAEIRREVLTILGRHVSLSS